MSAQAILDIIARTDDFERRMKGVEQTSRRVRDAMRGVATSVNSMNKQLGSDSAFGKFVQIGMAGGALAGLSMAGRLLGDMATQAGELAAKLRAGELAAEDLAGEILKIIPIVRDWYRAVEAIYRIFDPLPANLNKQVEAQGKLLRGLGQQLKLVSAANDLERAKLEAETEYQARLVEIAKLQMEAQGPLHERARAARATAEATERYARGLRDAKLAAAELVAEEARRRPIEDFIAGLERELEALTLNEQAIIHRALAAQGATEADIARALAIHQAITAIHDETEATEKAAQAEDQWQQSIDSVINSLREQVETFGMSTGQLAAWTLLQHDASDATLELAEALSEELDTMNELASAQRRAASIAQAVRTPAEVFRDTLAELSDLLSRDLIDPETFARAGEQAKAALESALTVAPVQVRVQAFETIAGAFNRIAASAATPRPAEDQTARNTGRMVALAEKEISEITRLHQVTKNGLSAVELAIDHQDRTARFAN
jgi:hypothetical protein